MSVCMCMAKVCPCICFSPQQYLPRRGDGAFVASSTHAACFCPHFQTSMCCRSACSDISLDGGDGACVVSSTHGPGSVLWTGHADGTLRAYPPDASHGPSVLRNGLIPQTASSLRGTGGGTAGSTGGSAASKPYAVTTLCAAGGSSMALWVGDGAGRIMAVCYNPSVPSIRILVSMSMDRITGSTHPTHPDHLNYSNHPNNPGHPNHPNHPGHPNPPNPPNPPNQLNLCADGS